MSEAGHHQLIRHRALEILPLMPNVDYGLLIPEEIVAIKDRANGKKAMDLIIDVYNKSCDMYDKFVASDLLALSPYVVINANMRKSTFFGNLQGMARFVTLRTEEHAQDEIRTVANDIGDAYVEFETIYPGLKVNRRDMK